MKTVMTRAWKIAKEAAVKFGGKAIEYIATAMKMAWAEFKKGEIKMIITKEINGKALQIKLVESPFYDLITESETRRVYCLFEKNMQRLTLVEPQEIYGLKINAFSLTSEMVQNLENEIDSMYKEDYESRKKEVESYLATINFDDVEVREIAYDVYVFEDERLRMFSREYKMSGFIMSALKKTHRMVKDRAFDEDGIFVQVFKFVEKTEEDEVAKKEKAKKKQAETREAWVLAEEEDIYDDIFGGW